MIRHRVELAKIRVSRAYPALNMALVAVFTKNKAHLQTTKLLETRSFMRVLSEP